MKEIISELTTRGEMMDHLTTRFFLIGFIAGAVLTLVAGRYLWRLQKRRLDARYGALLQKLKVELVRRKAIEALKIARITAADKGE